MPEKEFLSDVVVFERWRRAVEEAVFTHRVLPSQLFSLEFERFFFEEFDWAMSKEFWTCISRMARCCGDRSCLIAVLEPDPSKYYKDEFGFYSWAELDVACTPDDYWRIISAAPDCGSAADSIVANANRAVWTAKSGAWYVYGERSAGICVFGSKEREWCAGSWKPKSRCEVAEIITASLGVGQEMFVNELLERYARGLS